MRVGNVPLGIHQKIARQSDDPLIRPTTGSWRQFCNRLSSHVYTDDGKIAVVEFPNVGTPGATGAFCSVGVRVCPDPAQKNGLRIHAAQQSGKCGENASIKYSVYAVVRICGFEFL